ncbi:MAG: oligosaccharide flippase family protein [Candidatus Omnitrophica bacterium]|nr:oligosaccharide flippase family protein [Candidatus Omnitrophota bacterium]
MVFKLEKQDRFTKNIIIVFAGNILSNFCNLLYQLLIAHRLALSEFAAFNALLSIFMMISAPLATIQLVLAKYVSEFNAHNFNVKICALISGVLKRVVFCGVLTLLIFAAFSPVIVNAMKIESVACGYILAAVLALAWVSPVFFGSLQGLELFGWFSFSQIITGIAKLIFAAVFLVLGFRITGALGALLISAVLGLAIVYLPIKKSVRFGQFAEKINFREVAFYLLPVGFANFCFMVLVTMDMVLVRYFFPQQESGFYSVGQMAGKIFLFLPTAISIVMFPKTSGLKAKNLDTRAILNRSLVFGAILSILAACAYNLFPGLCLSILTGKPYPEAIFLGRLFAVSMSIFALLFILISYFLSIKDLRFLKYLGGATLLQVMMIILFHSQLWQVQLIMCVNAALLFSWFLFLIYGKNIKAK